MCVKICSFLLFILFCGQFGQGKIGNYSKPTLGIVSAPPDQDGPERRWWGYGHTPGADAPGLDPLATIFVLWAAG